MPHCKWAPPRYFRHEKFKVYGSGWNCVTCYYSGLPLFPLVAHTYPLKFRDTFEASWKIKIPLNHSCFTYAKQWWQIGFQGMPWKNTFIVYVIYKKDQPTRIYIYKSCRHCFWPFSVVGNFIVNNADLMKNVRTWLLSLFIGVTASRPVMNAALQNEIK
jgi:hypothetical protein